MNVLEMLKQRFADSGHQDITVDGSTIDPAKGCIRLNVGGASTVYLPRIAESGHLPFFLIANSAHDYTIKDNIADGTSTVVTLNSGGVSSAVVYYDGYAWRALTMTTAAVNALLNTLLTRNGADGIISLAANGTVTYNDQVVVLGDNLGGAYNVTMPLLADTDAMPYFFWMAATGALTATIKEAAGDGGSTIGTLVYGVDAGGMVIGNGSNYTLLHFRLLPVGGPSSTTENNIPQWDAVTGLLKDGLGVETAMTSVDTAVPTSKAVLDQVTPLETWVKNHVVEGGVVSDGTLGSSHNEATPEHDFNANVTAGTYIVNNVMGYLTAVTNGDLSNDGAADPLSAVNTDIYYAVVVKEAAGSLSYQYVEGVAGAAPQTPIADADITTAVGHARWIRIADVLIHRSGAATLDFTAYNAVKPVLG